jgi:hypothetical protein
MTCLEVAEKRRRKILKNIFLVLLLATTGSMFAADGDVEALLHMDANHNVVDKAGNPVEVSDPELRAAIEKGTATRAQEIGAIVEGGTGDLLVEQRSDNDDDNDDKNRTFTSPLSNKTFSVPKDVANTFVGDDGREKQAVFFAEHVDSAVSEAVAHVVESSALTNAESAVSSDMMDTSRVHEVNLIKTSASADNRTFEGDTSDAARLKNLGDTTIDDDAQLDVLTEALEKAKTAVDLDEVKTKVEEVKTAAQADGKLDATMQTQVSVLDADVNDREAALADPVDTSPKSFIATAGDHISNAITRVKDAAKDLWNRMMNRGKSGEKAPTEAQVVSDDVTEVNALHTSPESYVKAEKSAMEKIMKDATTPELKEAALPQLEDQMELLNDAAMHLIKVSAMSDTLSVTKQDVKQFDPETYLERTVSNRTVDSTTQRLGKAWVETGISEGDLKKINAESKILQFKSVDGRLQVEENELGSMKKIQRDLTEADYKSLGKSFLELKGDANPDGNMYSSSKKLADLSDPETWLRVTAKAEFDYNTSVGKTAEADVAQRMLKTVNDPFSYPEFANKYLGADAKIEPLSQKDAQEVSLAAGRTVGEARKALDAFKNPVLKSEVSADLASAKKGQLTQADIEALRGTTKGREALEVRQRAEVQDDQNAFEAAQDMSGTDQLSEEEKALKAQVDAESPYGRLLTFGDAGNQVMADRRTMDVQEVVQEMPTFHTPQDVEDVKAVTQRFVEIANEVQAKVDVSPEYKDALEKAQTDFDAAEDKYKKSQKTLDDFVTLDDALEDINMDLAKLTEPHVDYSGDHIAVTSPKTAPVEVMMDDELYNAVDPDVQEVDTEAAKFDDQAAKVKQMTSELIENTKDLDGQDISTENKAAIQKAESDFDTAQKAYEASAKTEDDFETLKNALEDINTSMNGVEEAYIGELSDAAIELHEKELAAQMAATEEDGRTLTQSSIDAQNAALDRFEKMFDPDGPDPSDGYVPVDPNAPKTGELYSVVHPDHSGSGTDDNPDEYAPLDPDAANEDGYGSVSPDVVEATEDADQAIINDEQMEEVPLTAEERTNTQAAVRARKAHERIKEAQTLSEDKQYASKVDLEALIKAEADFTAALNKYDVSSRSPDDLTNLRGDLNKVNNAVEKATTDATHAKKLAETWAYEDKQEIIAKQAQAFVSVDPSKVTPEFQDALKELDAAVKFQKGKGYEEIDAVRRLQTAVKVFDAQAEAVGFDKTINYESRAPKDVSTASAPTTVTSDSGPKRGFAGKRNPVGERQKLDLSGGG